jgi:hypothetical protein
MQPVASVTIGSTSSQVLPGQRQALNGQAREHSGRQGWERGKPDFSPLPGAIGGL